MAQVNLLPDVKLEFVKARKLKRTIISICVLVSAAALAIFVLMFVSVAVVQRQHLNNLDEDITEQTKQLKSMSDIAEILTIQNQLGSLTALHKDKPVASRIFTYIQQLAPGEASISTLTVNFDEQTMEIAGNATNLAGVNKFADTLKFTSYVIEAENPGTPQSAFNEVTLTQFGISASSAISGKPASYTIKLKYAPEIFSGENNVKLTIPNQVTTRSQTEKPQGVFEAPATTEGGDQ